MNKPLIREIKGWKKTDQKIRHSFKWPEDLKNKKKLDKFKEIDRINHKRILDLISIYGYPTSKLLGKKGMQNFWLLVQHQDRDTKLQKTCLKKCDFGKKEMAYLTDRILIHAGKKQIYGTQYRPKNGKYILFPLQNPAKVSKLRKDAGLESLDAYLKRAGAAKK